MQESSVDVAIKRIAGTTVTNGSDAVAVEEPLAIRIVADDASGRRGERAVSVTMRTPGNDFDLAAGLLLSEGIVRTRGDIISARHAGLTAGDAAFRNVVTVEIVAGHAVDVARLERHSYASSACGVCGKTSIDAVLAQRRVTAPSSLRVDASTLHALPAALRATQPVFDRTGGLHAAALFDRAGALLAFREDVGRHNAVDKLLGAELLADRLPLADRILMLSGRASFELVQKAMMASVPIVAAVGAPSSLAVELAEACAITLVGFVRDGRFNVYAGSERLFVS